ncbi:MAG: VOC family protein [Rhodospirillales bacterium]|nr:VOC family protein [Alphaproteobacteria bacterium]MCB9986785.1 VOC family protein [Rhodospirillales bacterium]USO08447.1 MAG: VOC family protein [Rhodospirillales bacterium]
MTAALAPELIVSDFDASLEFYQAAGFTVAWARPDERFAYLTLGDAALMIEEGTSADYVRGPLEKPYGRGINFQIIVPDVEKLREVFVNATILRDLMDKTYRTGATTRSFRELMVSDPDGYVLRFQQPLA